MTKRHRIDSILVAREYFFDIESAKIAVMSGRVFVAEQKVLKPTETFLQDCALRILEKDKYVSRAAYKLLSCIEGLNLQKRFQNKIVYDIGSSTGGFTQVALEFKAAHVYAIDVGSNQLDYTLRTHNKVTPMEKTNILELSREKIPAADIIMVDISFQSVSRIASKIIELGVEKKALTIALIKPQFELPRRLVPKGGVIINPEHIAQAISTVKETLQNIGVGLIHEFYSSILGRQGNQEVFLVFDNN